MKPFFDQSTRVLFQLRFIRVIDALFAVAIASAISTVVWCALTGHPTAAMGWALFTSVAFNAWLVLLVFRCAYYTLQCRADINTMTVRAAQLVHAYQLGPPPAGTAPPPGAWAPPGP
jgi:hypothetical protein